MLNIVKRLFLGSQQEDDADRRDFMEKKAGLERLLGPMDEEVDWAHTHNNPSGADLVFFSQGLPGTAFATMGLIQPFRHTPKARRPILYELVAFTKHTIEEASSSTEPSVYYEVENRISSLFSTIARYSAVSTLKPGDCCEIPQGKGESAYMVFAEFTKDGEGLHIGSERYLLLLCMEVHREEMEYARLNGNAALFEKLKAVGIYPYSDLDRESVV